MERLNGLITKKAFADDMDQLMQYAVAASTENHLITEDMENIQKFLDLALEINQKINRDLYTEKLLDYVPVATEDFNWSDFTEGEGGIYCPTLSDLIYAFTRMHDIGLVGLFDGDKINRSEILMMAPSYHRIFKTNTLLMYNKKTGTLFFEDASYVAEYGETLWRFTYRPSYIDRIMAQLRKEIKS